MRLTFEQFADDLADGLSPNSPPDTERSVLIEEVKIGCTLGMLQCLDRPHRLVYVLGEILELSGPEAADVLGISAELFESACSMHVPGLSRSHEPTAVWSRIMPRARATGVCRPRCNSGVSNQRPSISPTGRRRLTTFAGWSARSRRHVGLLRFIAVASLARLRWTSRGACSRLSRPGFRHHQTSIKM